MDTGDDDLSEKCGWLEKSQAEYRGTLNVTATGKTCQRWDSQASRADRLTDEWLLFTYCLTNIRRRFSTDLCRILVLATLSGSSKAYAKQKELPGARP